MKKQIFMYSKHRYFLLSLLISLTFISATCDSNLSNPSNSTSFQIAFYNVENLFDTINDPLINDEEYLPSGKKQWNSKKYNEKLTHLSAVLDSLKPGSTAPEIIGLCEIENKNVLIDLVAQKNLISNNYQIVHHESPDKRGIDVACIYNSQVFKLLSNRKIPITIPADTNFYTRDILFCEFMHIASKEIIYVYVNHWSSRSGGEVESAPKRAACANALLTDITKKISDYSQKNIVIIGDMNDYPTNESIYTILGAKEPSQNQVFNNLMHTKHLNKEGTYFYKGEWGVLDNLIVSKNLMKYTSEQRAVIYKRDWMLYTTSKGEKAPSRSYSGDNYYSGYSDHLPVYVEFSLK